MAPTIKLEIPESQVQELLSIYLGKLNKLDKEREEAQVMVDYLMSVSGKPVTENLLFTTNNTHQNKPQKSTEITKLANGYIKQWAWVKKILFVLKASEKPMTAKQIGEYILDNLEPELESEKKRMFSTISGQVSLMFAKQKTLDRKTNELDEFEYEIIEK